MRVVRGLVGLAGVVIAVVGVLKVLDRGSATVIEALKWFVGGTLLHDAVLAPIVVLLGALAVPRVPTWARMPLVTGVIVLGTTSVAVFPMLTGFGAISDNPTLLDRNYAAGWWALAALTGLGMAAGCWWQRRTAAADGSSTVHGPATPAPADRPEPPVGRP